MKAKTFLIIVGVIFGLVLMAGCAKKAPQEDINTAQSAFEAAKAAEADRYAPDEFKTAKDALDTALAEVNHQNSRFGPTRNYDQARQLLQSATIAANTATDAATANKEKVHTETQDLLAQTQVIVQETKDLLADAPKGKGGEAALDAIQKDLADVETSLSDVTATMNNGDLLNARDQAKALLAKANSIKAELQQAIKKQAELSMKAGHRITLN